MSNANIFGIRTEHRHQPPRYHTEEISTPTGGGGYPRGLSCQGVKINTIHLHLGPKLRIGEAIHQPTHNAVTASRRQFYLLIRF